MTISQEEKLLLQREQLLDDLSQINVRARSLVMELRILDRKILMHGKAGEQIEWAGYRLAIDVITAYLEKRGRAVPVDVMAREIVAGGWSSADDRAFFNIRDSVRYHCRTAKGLEKKMLKQIPPEADGLVGLWDWKKDKFSPALTAEA